MIGIISSRLLGMLSPDLRYRLTSRNSNRRLSLSSAVAVTAERSEPAHTSTGVLHLETRAAGASLGTGAPMLITPPSSLVLLLLSLSGAEAEDWMATVRPVISTVALTFQIVGE
jgi:hypothetical protein